MNEEQRTIQQNKALHKYCEILADTFNDAGYDMKYVLSFKVLDVPWNKDLVKEALWKEVQKAVLGTDSTTQLSTTDIDKVYNVLNRFISEKFGIYVEWPSNR